MELIDKYVLSFMTFVPMIACFFVLLAPSVKLAKWIALGGTLLSFAASMHVWFHFQPGTAGLQFVERYSWLPAFGVSYFMGVDGLSLLLIVLTTFLTPLILISQWHEESPRHKAFLALFLALETGMLGSLVAMDMVFFYVFWEAMLIPMYFIIGIWGGKTANLCNNEVCPLYSRRFLVDVGCRNCSLRCELSNDGSAVDRIARPLPGSGFQSNAALVICGVCSRVCH